MKGFSSPQRGSVLLVALIFATIIGISLASYVSLGRTNLDIATRAFYNNAAMNLAETGLEQSIWSLNQTIDEDTKATAFDGWTHNDGTLAWSTFSGGSYGQNTTGKVRVYVDRTVPTKPKIIARATIDPTRGSDIEKWIEVTLSKRSRYANGLVARNSVLFKGNNATVDSWNSERDDSGNLRASPVAYDAAYRHDNGSVASVSVSVDSVLVQNADVWGYVSTGGDDPTDNVGPNGSILGDDSPSGTKVDPNRVATDFTADLDVEAQPTGGTAIAAISSLPQTLGGTVGTDYVYSLPSISGGGNSSNVLTVTGNVTLYITATSGQSAINIGGQASITITAGSSLTIYTAGNVDIGGNGILNTNNQPKTFEIIGTSTSTTQTISIAGNGALKGVVYAPNASVTIVGNGDVMGSIVGNNITLTGNAAFHYDESLADDSEGEPYGISKWKELTDATDRNIYTSKLSF